MRNIIPLLKLLQMLAEFSEQRDCTRMLSVDRESKTLWVQKKNLFS